MELELSDEHSKYKGQWGGKTDTGEEMWWSEPSPALMSGSRLARFKFWLDVRQHFILNFFKKSKNQNKTGALKVLDYGCGAAGTTLNLSRYLNQPILGLDIFETQLGIARTFAKKYGVPCEFQCLDHDGTIPLPDASTDVIFSLDVLGHVPNIPATLSEWARVLKKGGSVCLFTEATYSDRDRSWMHKLAKKGMDMVAVVPEHISLFPRETLEVYFRHVGFTIEERFSANVWHFFFFPKDYVLMMEKSPQWKKSGAYLLAWFWNRISKLTPFYPWPFQALRLLITKAFGRKAYGTGYFYYLKKT